MDAVEVVAADAEAANNKSQLSDPKPLIHGPLFMDFVGCPPAMDRYNFCVIL